MSEGYIAIVDSEPGFAKNLASGLSRVDTFPYVIHSFESKDAYMKQDPLIYDVLLINYKDTDADFKEYIEQETKTTGKPEMIYLTEQKENKIPDGFPTVYKYQQVRQLVNDFNKIKHREGQAYNGTEEEKPDGMVIGVAGAVGRCGKTSFALALSLKLAENRSVLFANFDTCTSLKVMLKEIIPEEGKDIADLIYMLRYQKEETDFSEYLFSYQGVDIICPVHMQEDLYKTDPSEYVNLIFDMVRIRKYGAVVLDLGGNLYLTEGFLPHITHLYIPTRKDPLSSEKTAVFRDWISRMDQSINKPVISEILLPSVHPFYSGKNYLSQIKWSDLGQLASRVLSQKDGEKDESEKSGNYL